MIYPNGRSRYFRKEWNVLKPDNSEAMRKYRKQKEKYYQEYLKAQKKQNQEWRKYVGVRFRCTSPYFYDKKRPYFFIKKSG